MSRSRKPAEVQTKKLSIIEFQTRKDEEEAVALPNREITDDPPTWMKDSIAATEWKRVVPQLKKIDIVGNLDFSNIVGYCYAYATYRRATDRIGTHLILKDPDTGKVYENPNIDVQIKAAQEMRRFADMCGMTINSRLKAAATKTKTTEDQIEKKFGAI